MRRIPVFAAALFLVPSLAHAKGCPLEVTAPLPDRTAYAGTAFSYTFPADAFQAEITDPGTGARCCDLATSDPVYGAYDYDGGNYSPLPAWLSFDPGTRAFSGTPTSGDEGSAEVVVTVSGCGGSAEDNFILTVSAQQTGGGSSGVVSDSTRFSIRKYFGEGGAGASSSSGGSSGSSGSGGGNLPPAWVTGADLGSFAQGVAMAPVALSATDSVPPFPTASFRAHSRTASASRRAPSPGCRRSTAALLSRCAPRIRWAPIPTAPSA